MASIKPNVNKNGEITSYTIHVYDGMRNGRKIQKTKTVKLEDLDIPARTRKRNDRIQKEIQKIAIRFEDEVKNGSDFSDAKKITFNDLLEKWNENVLSVKVINGDISEGCRERYIRIIELYALPEIDGITINKINPVNIDNTITRMTMKKLCSKTIRNYFNALHQCFEYARKNKLIANNPCNDVSALPKAKKKQELHTFTEEQTKRFLNDALKVDIPRSNAWKKQMDILFFTMDIYGGFRKSELLALTWNDIDWNNQIVSINKAVGYNNQDKEFIKSPKTISGNRIVPLPVICFKLLSEWKNQCKEICMKAGKEWQGSRGNDFDDNYIFIRENGLRMSNKEPYKHLRLILNEYNNTVLEYLKLPLLRVHDLRHTCATLLLANGIDPVTVASILGHKDTTTTFKIYAHPLETKKKEASNRLESILMIQNG